MNSVKSLASNLIVFRQSITQQEIRCSSKSAIYTIRYRTSKGTEEEVLKERWGVFLAKMEIITNDNDTEDSEDVANKQANMFSEYFQNCSKT